jgi:hypothetical protein
MKRIASLFVAAALLAVATHAQAGDFSQSRLAAMGLPGMKTMTDEEGAAVRGSGSGSSAGSSFRSFVIAIGTGPNYGYPAVNVVVAGGFSIAQK